MTNATKQKAYYTEITAMVLADELETGVDYFKVDSIAGVDYYSPNDEDLGSIVAVSHSSKLAHYTGFYDMDDMEAEDSEYAFVVHNGELMSQFEVS